MARDDFTVDKFMSDRKAELLMCTDKKIQGGRIERSGSLRRLNDEDLKVLKLGYKEPTESSFTLNDIEYEQSVRKNLLKVASDLSNPSLSHENEKGGDGPSYGTEAATAKDIAVFRALCSTLAESVREYFPETTKYGDYESYYKIPPVLGLARLKGSVSYGVGFSGKNNNEWPKSKSDTPTLDNFSAPIYNSIFYNAAICAIQAMNNTTLHEMGIEDTTLFLADPKLLRGDGNLCGACRAVLSARLQYSLQGTITDFSDEPYNGGRRLTITRDKAYSEAMVLETTTPFYTSYLVDNAPETGVSGYHTSVTDVIDPQTGKNALATPIRRNSHASLMSSCKICKGERKSRK